jgi:non-heme chloroperoxidase
MHPLTTPAADTPPADTDLAEQARPGHGVPSQDPDPAAQDLLDPKEAAREAESVLTAGSLLAGAATGAAIGVVVGGPVGVVVGASLGAVAGALGSAAATTPVNPKD